MSTACFEDVQAAPLAPVFAFESKATKSTQKTWHRKKTTQVAQVCESPLQATCGHRGTGNVNAAHRPKFLGLFVPVPFSCGHATYLPASARYVLTASTTKQHLETAQLDFRCFTRKCWENAKQIMDEMWRDYICRKKKEGVLESKS